MHAKIPQLKFSQLFLFIPLLLLFIYAHPFYLSVTDLKYNSKSRLLEGSVKIFTNDLESALKKLNKSPVDLINVTDSSKTKRILGDYIKNHLQIRVNNTEMKYEVLGFETEAEATWIYLEVSTPEIRSINVKNTILYDFLKSQSNIVHIQVKDQTKSLKVNYPEESLDFLF